jgi:hypothetical protein
MNADTYALANLLVGGWVVMYSLSLTWSFYNLLDQWPRLIRFGRTFTGSGGRMIISGWLLMITLTAISLGALVRGTLHFGHSGWQASKWFPLVFVLVGLTAFITPVFINRAVWGFALLSFPNEYRTFVGNPDYRIYWERRVSLEAAQRFFIRPRYSGGWIFGESVAIVLVLSWAVSGIYPRGLFLSYDVFPAFWALAPSTALLVAILAHYPWPARVNVADNITKLPSTLLGGVLEKRVFSYSLGNMWVANIVDFRASLSHQPSDDRKQARRLVFCSHNPDEVLESPPPERALSEMSLRDLRDRLEAARRLGLS